MQANMTPSATRGGFRGQETQRTATKEKHAKAMRGVKPVTGMQAKGSAKHASTRAQNRRETLPRTNNAASKSRPEGIQKNERIPPTHRTITSGEVATLLIGETRETWANDATEKGNVITNAATVMHAGSTIKPRSLSDRQETHEANRGINSKIPSTEAADKANESDKEQVGSSVTRRTIDNPKEEDACARRRSDRAASEHPVMIAARKHDTGNPTMTTYTIKKNPTMAFARLPRTPSPRKRK